MAKKPDVPLPAEEIADFLATCPTPEQWLQFRPSAQTQQRVRDLLDKSKAGRISEEEQWGLDQFEFAESLVQLVKVRLRPRRVPRS
jgi:hypothetical protein